ncbi:PEBP family protein [Methylobacterium sp. 4-46]|uniref:YbhB/YbcL family Raf kinase inhibitor-like protein n=1 Tax=unclassified Methylobacterium TaxID=2615210 RepID=UPI000152DD9A|nr:MULTISPECIES: YbhB/YbcL family Raf kinase inhibitor-like protein [Methylobacterium]ACA14648.1 PEBP family protein [Methylobacterium sp. 4-46]WFT80401.1 YbhB/YbcL family Raf kinase inhibitor-like protein [Methylobacterium nodulans]
MAFTLTSPAFANGALLPSRYARHGENLSPPLAWSNPPPDTRSFVLILEDPDAPAPSFRHWVIYDIPHERRHLPEGGSSGAAVEGLPHAVNGFRNAHYDGPAPPPGDPPHTYRFRLLALGIAHLGLDGQPSAAQVWDVARENILSEAELTATFRR